MDYLFSRFKSNRECMGNNGKKNKVKRYYTLSDLIEAVKSASDKIDLEVIENYIYSMFGRINDCIFINGDKINNLDYSIKKIKF